MAILSGVSGALRKVTSKELKLIIAIAKKYQKRLCIKNHIIF